MKNLEIMINKLSTNTAQFISRQKRVWTNRYSIKMLFVTGNSRIEQSQIFPFYYYRKELRSVYGCDLREINTTEIEFNNRANFSGADVVLCQPWFSLGMGNIIEILTLLRDANPNARIVYIDPSAPADLRFANLADPLIDLCVKKHVFTDRQLYGKPTQGDTNLVQYYERLYELPASPSVLFPVPESFIKKLVVGPSFFTSREMLPRISSLNSCAPRKRSILIHARLGKNGVMSYQKMRESALASCSPFKSNSIVTSDLIGYRSYINELNNSKICFSPFGYGEVCWRDYEAVVAGALLLKPDMKHIETKPSIFIPYETYVPVKWDFSDLSEKVEYYLSHENEANDIVKNAYRVLYEYDSKLRFIDQMSPLFVKE